MTERIEAAPIASTSPAHGPIQALGYIGLRTNNLDAWPAFAGGVLGMQVVHEGPDSIRLRMDEKAHRYVLTRDATSGLDFVGFEVSSATALSALQSALQQNGLTVQRGTASERAARRVEDLVWLADPAGAFNRS